MALSCYQLNGVLLLYVAICGVLAAAACVYVFVGAPFYDPHFAPRYFYPALGVDDVDDDDNDPPSVIELPLDDGDAARALLRRECKPYFWQKFNGLGLLHQRTLAMTALAYLRGGVVVHRDRATVFQSVPLPSAAACIAWPVATDAPVMVAARRRRHPALGACIDRLLLAPPSVIALFPISVYTQIRFRVALGFPQSLLFLQLRGTALGAAGSRSTMAVPSSSFAAPPLLRLTAEALSQKKTKKNQNQK